MYIYNEVHKIPRQNQNQQLYIKNSTNQEKTIQPSLTTP